MKIKSLFLMIIVLYSYCLAHAQDQDSIRVDEEEPKYQFIVLNGKYQNAFTFLGRDFGQTVPLFSTDLTYLAHSGFFFNLSAFKFLVEEVPFQYGLSLGYMGDLSANSDFNISYSQFLVGDISELIGVQNLGVFQTTFGLDWGVLYSTLQGQVLFNQKTDFFLGTQHSRYFQLDQKIFNAIRFSFEPKVSLLAGTSRFFLMGGFENMITDMSDLDQFILLNWEAALPLAFAVGGFELEFTTRYVRPLNSPRFDPSTNRFVFGIDLSYAIPIKKKK